MEKISNKISNVIKGVAIALAIAIALVIIFILGYAFFPDVFDPAVARIQDLISSIPPINIQDSQFINFNMDLELPKFDLNFDNILGGGESADPSFRISGLIIAAVIVAMIIACIRPIASTIVAILFSVLGGNLAVQAVAVYKEQVASGATTWKAAGSCFWPLFLIYIIVLFGGLASAVQEIFDDYNNIVKILGTIILSVIVAAVFSLIITLIVLLICGLGWAGGVYLFLGLAIVASGLLEILVLSST